MARFDVYQLAEGNQLVIDVQSEILSDLRTRVVIPLSPKEAAQRELMPRLRPMVQLGGCEYSVNTMEIASIPCELLGDHVGNLEDHHQSIIDAIDFLMQGF